MRVGSGRDLALLLGNCADTFEKNIARSKFGRPLAILARSPRDKFINLATLGGPSPLLASRGTKNYPHVSNKFTN